MSNPDGNHLPGSGAEILWPEPPPDWNASLTTSTASVQVWAATLDLKGATLEAFAATLCAEELARAGRLRSEPNRGRFVVGRGLLRMILGRYARVEPGALEFGYGPQGKPFLAGERAGCGWDFNLTHAQGLALLAIASRGPVGVDVEGARLPPDAAEIVARFFSARESSRFQDLPAELKPAAFLNLWTRKEAWLKATGAGLGGSLSQVEVSFVPGEPARLLSLPGGGSAAEDWALHSLTPAPGYVGALVVPALVPAPQCWRWRSETGFSGAA